MTTIAAVRGSSWVLVACDSVVVAEGERKYVLPEDTAKVFWNGSYLMGIAGDLRVINVLQHVFEPPDASRIRGTRLDKFMVSSFIPALRTCMEENLGSSKNFAECYLLVVVNKVAYEIGNNYEIIRDEIGIHAVGTGAQFALGALYALCQTDPAERDYAETEGFLEEAVKIAVSLDPSSTPPVMMYVQD